MSAKYKLWHIPQVPGKPFEVRSDDLGYLVKLRDVLSNYDEFQLRENIKPDYSNVNGICTWDGVDWYDLDPEEIEGLLDGTLTEMS
jgi:hypothetical protein